MSEVPRQIMSARDKFLLHEGSKPTERALRARKTPRGKLQIPKFFTTNPQVETRNTSTPQTLNPDKIPKSYTRVLTLRTPGF